MAEVINYPANHRVMWSQLIPGECDNIIRQVESKAAAKLTTTFAPTGNPWVQQEKEKKKMVQANKQTPPARKSGDKFHGKTIPPAPKLSAAQASARIDPDKLVISDMPFPGRTVSLVSKYAAKFATLPVNRRLVCESQDAPAISTSLKQWAEKHKPGHVARHVRDCGDGMGGVWLLEEEK